MDKEDLFCPIRKAGVRVSGNLDLQNEHPILIGGGIGCLVPEEVMGDIHNDSAAWYNFRGTWDYVSGHNCLCLLQIHIWNYVSSLC